MADEQQLEEGRMPFFEHLRELRERLRKAAMAFVVAVVVAWFYAHDIYEWLRVPLNNAWLANKDVLGATPVMAFTKPTEPFWVQMSVAMWAGIFVASPFIFYQLWKFVAPGLYKKERRIGLVFSAASAGFFVLGAWFCYRFVLENLYTFLLSYSESDLKPQIKIDEYFDLTKDMMLAFGAVFEMPVLIYFLAKIGLVTHRSLWKFNRWFIVLAFIIGAVLTPSPDPISQIMMAVPMVLLYNMSILTAYVVVRNKEKKKAAQRAADRAADERATKKRRIVEEEDAADDDEE
jgi:sec-independent protein translocase protein TatC